MNNVLPIEINIIFEIYSSSADRREDTGHHTQKFLVLEIVYSLASMSYLAIGEKRVENI